MSIYVCISKLNEEVSYYMCESKDKLKTIININNYEITRLSEFMKYTLKAEQIIKI